MKTLFPDLFPETLLVSAEGDACFTTSLKIAEHFHKRHKNVLRDIEALLESLPEAEFSRLNFEPSEYRSARGKTYQVYRLTRDGFTILAMGFTGGNALRWKLDFIAAFNAMEAQLLRQVRAESAALYKLRHRWSPIAKNPGMKRQQLIALTGHRSVASITACRRRMREVGLL